MKITGNGLVIGVSALLVGFAFGHWVMPAARATAAIVRTPARTTPAPRLTSKELAATATLPRPPAIRPNVARS